MKSYLMFFGIFLVLSSQTFGTDYYVDRNNGSNISGNGTINSPWETISYALSKITGTGHTIYVAPGVYNRTISKEGWSEIFPIVIMDGISLLGSDSATTIIDAEGEGYTLLIDSNSNYNIIEQLKIKGGNPAGIFYKKGNTKIHNCQISENNNIGLKAEAITGYILTLDNNVINKNSGLNDHGYGIKCTGSGKYIITNNIIEENNSNSTFDHGYGIYTHWTVEKLEIRGNQIKKNKGGMPYYEGFGIASCADSVIIIDNLIEANGPSGAGIALWVVNHARIDSNKIKNNSIGIDLGNPTQGGALDFGSVIIRYNDIVDNSQTGINTKNGDFTEISNNLIFTNNAYAIALSQTDKSHLYNNTIYSNKGGVTIGENIGYLDIINNIIADNKEFGIKEEGSTADPSIASYNLFFNNKFIYYDEGLSSYSSLMMLETFVTECSKNLEGDPLFVDSEIGDFHLLPGSPAIDAGYPSFDYSNEPQPNGGRINIGAYGNTPEATISGLDTKGPKTNNISVSPNPTSGANSIILKANISDIGFGTSNIVAAEYFIDTIDTNGTGLSMSPSDGIYDTPTENVQATVDVTSWQVGSSHKVYVHGKDVHNNWGNFDSVTVLVTSAVLRELSIPNKSAAPGDIVVIPVLVDTATGIAGAEIKITYDSNILTAMEASTTTLTQDFTIVDSVMTGKIAITMACSTGLSGGSGEFANIKFQVSGNANIGATSPLHFELAALYDENTNLIPVTTQDGTFSVVSDTGGEIVRIFIKPPSDTLNISDTKEFSAYGKRSDSSEVAIAVNWVLENKFGNIGSINPGSGEKTTFTATGPGDGLIKATYNETLTANAVLVVGKLKGDINIDDKVNVQDAILCLQINAKMFEPYHLYQIWAADFNGDGITYLDVGDALAILSESLKGLLPKVLVYKTSGSATVRMGSFIYESDDIITLPILIEGRDDVFASGFEIRYNSQVLTALAATSSMPSSYLATNLNEPGTAKISLINTHGLVNSQGEIIKLKFKVNGKQDDNPELNIKQARLFDRQAQRIEANVNMDQETITAVPKAYQLHQNYPNPFNPTTSIRYSLPEASEIKLTVYNMAGQEIKTLATGKVAAGSHSVVWDGRDNAENAVPSGVYFYKLSAESQQWQSIKKMILIK